MSNATSSRGLSIGLWVVQALLAVMFLAAGLMKSTQPLDVMAANVPWVTYTPGWLVRFIGVSEFLRAIGLVAPAATRIQPWFTPLAAGLLAVVMVLAIGTHGVHAEWEALPVNLALGALAAFVAWGRFVKAPIAARG